MDLSLLPAVDYQTENKKAEKTKGSSRLSKLTLSISKHDYWQYVL